VPEFAGTLLTVKERPKVAKRPTLTASAARVKAAAAELTQAGLETLEPERLVAIDSSPAISEQLPPSKSLELPDAEPAPSEIAPAVAAAVVPKPKARRVAFGSTIPAKKPLVAKKPTIVPGKPKVAKTRTEKPNVEPTAAGQNAAAAKHSEAESKAPSVIAKLKEAHSFSWVPWIPIAAGIALASIAPQLHAFAAHWNPWGLRILFPFVQITALHEIGMSDELTRTLPQLMLYLQFPLEGLLVASNLRRGMRFSAAFGPVPALHFVCGLVIWIVALGQIKPL
jgi:hypothetical protein